MTEILSSIEAVVANAEETWDALADSRSRYWMHGERVVATELATSNAPVMLLTPGTSDAAYDTRLLNNR